MELHIEKLIGADNVSVPSVKEKILDAVLKAVNSVDERFEMYLKNVKELREAINRIKENVKLLEDSIEELPEWAKE